jgi:saccharopine dehydrogenase (NAD+, L-lysine-forming)
VLSCLPYRINKRIAEAAHARGIHYFDLTEDVPTTQAIIELARARKGLMGAAMRARAGLRRHRRRRAGRRIRGLPVVAAARRRAPAESDRSSLAMRSTGRPKVSVNEYLNDCEVIEDGVRKMVSSMEWNETIYVDGVMLEAFTTSGGLGTICETFHGKIAKSTTNRCAIPGICG